MGTLLDLEVLPTVQPVDPEYIAARIIGQPQCVTI